MSTHAKRMIGVAVGGNDDVIAMKTLTTQWAIFNINKSIFLKVL